MKKSLLLIIIFPGLLISCENDSENGNPVENGELLSRIIVNGDLFREFSYNESNLVTEEKSRFFYTGHSYDRFNNLVQSEFYVDPAVFSSSSYVVEEAMNRTEWVNPENTAKSLTQKFEYDNEGRLSRKYYVRTGSANTEYLEYEYENERIVRQKSYFNDVMTNFTNFEYDETGNLTRQERYYVPVDGPAQLQTTTEYEYDDMKNPFYAFKRLMNPGTYTNPNNIIKETYTIHFEVGPSIQKVTVTESTYEYNRRGYPERVNGDMEYIYR